MKLSQNLKVLKSCKILFVCTGNTCRSAMAEGIAKSMGLDAFSRGTFNLENSRASSEAVQICSENGIDITNHISNLLTEEDLSIADFVLCMGNSHIQIIEKKFPQYKHKVFLLGSFKNLGDIFDPIGMNLEYYRETYKKIRESIEKFILHINND